MVLVLLNTKLRAEIIIDYGKLRPMIGWLERNCVGEWGYTCLVPAGRDGDSAPAFERRRLREPA